MMIIDYASADKDDFRSNFKTTCLFLPRKMF